MIFKFRSQLIRQTNKWDSLFVLFFIVKISMFNQKIPRDAFFIEQSNLMNLKVNLSDWSSFHNLSHASV